MNSTYNAQLDQVSEYVKVNVDQGIVAIPSGSQTLSIFICNCSEPLRFLK